MILLFFYKKDNNNKFCFAEMFFIGNYNEFPGLERTNLLKINDNEFVATSRNNQYAVFFIGGDSILENAKIDNIITNGYPNSMLIHNSFLLIGGDTDKGIYLLNIKSYSLIGNVQMDFIRTYSFTNLANGHFLVAAEEDKINCSLTEFKIENNGLIEIKKKNFAHARNIISIIPYKGILITFSEDRAFKFWK